MGGEPGWSVSEPFGDRAKPGKDGANAAGTECDAGDDDGGDVDDALRDPPSKEIKGGV